MSNDHFYDDMFLELEDAADRAVLIRFQKACPYMKEAERQAFWEVMVLKYPTRADARTRLNQYLDFNLFDTFGQLRKEKTNGTR